MWKGHGASQTDVTSVTGTGRAGKTGELVCGGGMYKGEILAGQPNGKGQFFTSQYDGEWIRGRREGRGTCYYYNGETYQGQWISNQRHGQGRMQYSNGDAYEGSWIKDHRNGLAKYFYANGDVFVGRYEHNRREGLGTIYMIRKGKKHTAEYKADKPLCGTWAETDEESLAPMDDFLRASLPATVAPLVVTHLPELDVSQPDKVLQEVLSPLRCRPQKQLTLIKALRQQMNDFDEFELERLRHAFVRLSGGDSRVARLTPEKISDGAAAAIKLPSCRAASWGASCVKDKGDRAGALFSKPGGAAAECGGRPIMLPAFE
ncbi:MAG: hypothetical protein FRX49_01079 [Trebouxia sp. A1-2]|nr:MAG: hypothetical protein FRX49_01079 [Trebouxia sp. A1-2]